MKNTSARVMDLLYQRRGLGARNIFEEARPILIFVYTASLSSVYDSNLSQASTQHLTLKLHK